MANLRTIRIFGLLGLALLATGCGRDRPDEPFGPSGIPPHLRAGSGGLSASAKVESAGVPQTAAVAAAMARPNEDLVWTDADNPEAIIPELDTILTETKQTRGPWERSITIARRRAIREGKCLLIWFTDSQTSPGCKALSRELFSLHPFGKWADEHLVRLRVDTREPGRIEDGDLRVRAGDYVEALRDHYKVLGNPTVLMLSPQGEVLARYRGFQSGSGDFFWGQLKQAQRLGEKSYESWRADMESRGYREWSNGRGVSLFAKLASYRDGELVLIEPDGHRAKTREEHLGTSDRLWLAEQKRSRGIH